MDMDNNEQAAAGSGTADATTGGDALYALSDEQILDIAAACAGRPGEGREAATEGSAAADASRQAPPASSPASDSGVAGFEASASRQAANSGLRDSMGRDSPEESREPPRWLADMMADPQAGGEARDFWNGIQKARQEAASYREVFARPEEAREAAGHVRQLEELDRMYFAGDATSRARLAETLLRQDPAAFREMVFAGLRALEATEAQRHGEQREPLAPSAPAPFAPPAAAEQTIAAYRAFERAANEDLERSVGADIGRVLEQALPSAARAENAPLRERLSGVIRQEVEAALRGDGNLTDQVAQLLAARRFDDGTRAQVVRLIGERARQLVPVAAKRVLNEWTQTTLAAHRSRAEKTERAASRRDLEGVNALPGNVSKRSLAPRDMDYRRLTDEQILEM